MTVRPLVFLDVDGPLIPFGGNPREYPSWSTGVSANPLLRRINPGHGPRLAALGGELAWATSWMHDANEVICPLLGLRPMPVVPWSEQPDIDPAIHWKTADLVAFAAGRPFIWIDDEITGVDRAWVALHHQAPALLWRVDPRVGLTDDDFAELARWLAEVPAS